MIKENRSFWKKQVIYGVIVLMLLGAGCYYYFSSSPITITPYDEKRDTKQLLDIFKQDWYWLILGGDYNRESALYFLNVNTPKNRAKQLKIFVMRQGRVCIGFVALFMISPELGRLQFLAIDKKFRRHTYGAQLFYYGVQQLLAMGAKKVELLVRKNNIPAQKLYKKFGFYEIVGYTEPEGGIYFEYDPLKASLPMSLTSQAEPVVA